MYPTYNEVTRLLVIEWFERKNKKATPVHHYFEQKPVKLQLHPRDPKKIVRAHFTGKMPGWIKAYSEKNEHRFQCGEVHFGDEFGWYLLSWHTMTSDLQPLVSPSLRGAVHKLAEKIPDFFPELKSQLMDHVDVACKNLANYNDIFENIGIYYRSEEVDGEEGCLVVDGSVFLKREKNEFEENFKARYEAVGCLEKIVRELTNPLPDPDPIEEGKDRGTFEEEAGCSPDPLNEFPIGKLAAAEDEEILGASTPLEDEEIFGSLSSNADEEEIFGSLSPYAEEEEVFGSLSPDSEQGEIGTLSQESEDGVYGSLNAHDEVEEEQVTTSAGQDESDVTGSKGPTPDPLTGPTRKEIVVSSDESGNDKSDLKFVILDYSDKRRGVMEGQMSIF